MKTTLCCGLLAGTDESILDLDMSSYRPTHQKYSIWEEEIDVAAASGCRASLFVYRCSLIQLSSRRLQRTSPQCKKWIMGGIRMDNGFLQSTLYLQHFALISLQFVNGWRACQMFSVNFVTRAKFSCQTSENSP